MVSKDKKTDLSAKKAEFLARYNKFRPHIDGLIAKGYENWFAYYHDDEVVDVDESYIKLIERNSGSSFKREDILLISHPKKVRRCRGGKRSGPIERTS